MINFPFVPNGKLIIFRCPKIWAHYSLTIMCLNIRTAKNHHFPFWTNGKVVVLGVPILKHFRVYIIISYFITSAFMFITGNVSSINQCVAMYSVYDSECLIGARGYS